MAEGVSHNEPPIFYANFVTVSVDPDVLYLELRRYMVPHATMYSSSRSGQQAPPIRDEVIYAEDPVARVVLTYSAAKTLQGSLNELIPKMQNARREAGAE